MSRPTTFALLFAMIFALGVPANAARSGGGGGGTCSPTGPDSWSYLQGQINSLPSGGTLTLTANACYRVEKTLDIKNKQGITIEGNGATLRAFTVGDGTPPRPGAPPSNHNRSHIRITTSGSITINDLKIVGPNADGHQDPDLEGQHGIEMIAANHVNVSDVNVSSVFGDGFYVTKLAAVTSTAVSVTDSSVMLAGRHGVGVTDVVGATFTNNVINTVARSAFDLEPTTTASTISDVMVEANTVRNAAWAFVAAAGSGCGMDTITVRGNDVVGGTLAFRSNVTCHRHDIVVEDNQAVVDPASLDLGSWIDFFRVDDVVVRNNSVVMAHAEPGVTFNSSLGSLEVSGNTFCGASTVFTALGSNAVIDQGNSTTC